MERKRETIYKSGNIEVIYEGIDFGDIASELRVLLTNVLDVAATGIARDMRARIEKTFRDTGATANSVAVSAPDPMTREIGPDTPQAWYGEHGFVQEYVAIPPPKGGGSQEPKVKQKLKVPIWHPGLFFARKSLDAARRSFLDAVAAAIEKYCK